jgi:rod shape-determining protein MreD
MTSRVPRLLLIVALIVAALVVQVSVLPLLRLPGSTPDAVLLVVIGLALAYGAMSGTLIGFCAGLALDVVPPADHAMGRYALVFCLIGFCAGLGRREGRRSVVLVIAMVAAAAAFTVLAYTALGQIVGDASVTMGGLMRLLISAVGYDMLLSPFVVPTVMSLARRLAEPEPVLR